MSLKDAAIKIDNFMQDWTPSKHEPQEIPIKLLELIAEQSKRMKERLFERMRRELYKDRHPVTFELLDYE